MSEPLTNIEIEDVLSSIRRLVSEDPDAARPVRRSGSQDAAASPAVAAAGTGKPARAGSAPLLVLTPAFRVVEGTATGHGQAEPEPAAPSAAHADETDLAREASAGHAAGAREAASARKGAAVPDGAVPVQAAMPKPESAEHSAFGEMLRSYVAEAEAGGAISPAAGAEANVPAQPEDGTVRGDHSGEDAATNGIEDDTPAADRTEASAVDTAGGDAADDDEDESYTFYSAPDDEGTGILGDEPDAAEEVEIIGAAAVSDPAGTFTFSSRRDHFGSTVSHRPEFEDVGSIESRIAGLEAAINSSGEEFEPDGSEPGDQPIPEAILRPAAGTRAAEAWELHDPPPVHDLPGWVHEEDSFVAEDGGRDSPKAAGMDLEEALIDEDSLREIVGELVRQELRGELGEKITRNVRLLIRREINRALSLQDLSDVEEG